MDFRFGDFILTTLIMDKFLSNIELFYSTEVTADEITVAGEEKDHIIKVMRHSYGENIFVTDGRGKIYEAEIFNINKAELTARIIQTFSYTNEFSSYHFCIPKLKNPERFEFALEKSIELGITSFIIYNSIHGIRKGDKPDRWEKITISAMKQSLRSYKPQIKIIDRLIDIKAFGGNRIVLEQNSASLLCKKKLDIDKDYFFIFGPEGGLDEKEINLFRQS